MTRLILLALSPKTTTTVIAALQLILVASVVVGAHAAGLDDFSNNLATDLGPLLALFGDNMTKQYLSESLFWADYVIFATAPFSGFGTTSAGASIDVVDKRGMADLGEALRTDTMEDYGDVFVTP